MNGQSCGRPRWLDRSIYPLASRQKGPYPSTSIYLPLHLASCSRCAGHACDPLSAVPWCQQLCKLRGKVMPSPGRRSLRHHTPLSYPLAIPLRATYRGTSGCVQTPVIPRYRTLFGIRTYAFLLGAFDTSAFSMDGCSSTHQKRKVRDDETQSTGTIIPKRKKGGRR